MHFIRALLLVFAVLCSAALAAQNSAFLARNAPWNSYPTTSSNPDAAYAFSKYNEAPGRFDRNADGRVDLVIADRNNDGRGDYWATDRNFDGFFDDYQYDRNFDGRIDQWEYDQDYDGVSDKIYVDADGNGKPEMYADLNPINKTYTWYGNMSGTQAAGKVAFPALRSVGSRPLFPGRAADSQ